MTRLCFLCGKKIGFFRCWLDQQYCSKEHRREARLAASQALREEEDVEIWSVARSRDRKKGFATPGPSAGQTASIFAFLTVGGLLVAALMLPGPGTTYPPSVSLDPGLRRGMMQRASDAVGEVIRSSAPVTLHHDFHSGLRDWTTMALKAAPTVDDPRNWFSSSAAPEIVRPGSLRLWKRSIPLHNYQMEFMGQVEQRSLSWAFRASDQNNYYATKLLITKPGPLPNAGLVHYVVMNGQEWDRVQLPLPITLERGVNYRVRVSVQDDRFITYFNGQLISSWSDKRLHRGGVGFFADQEDAQEVAWVNLSERDSLLGRMLAYFSLIVMPGAELGQP
jgi:hypothetical protein